MTNPVPCTHGYLEGCPDCDSPAFVPAVFERPVSVNHERPRPFVSCACGERAAGYCPCDNYGAW